MDVGTTKPLSPPLPLCSLKHQVTSLTTLLPVPPSRHPFEAPALPTDTAQFPLGMDVELDVGIRKVTLYNQG